MNTQETNQPHSKGLSGVEIEKVVEAALPLLLQIGSDDNRAEGIRSLTRIIISLNGQGSQFFEKELGDALRHALDTAVGHEVYDNVNADGIAAMVEKRTRPPAGSNEYEQRTEDSVDPKLVATAFETILEEQKSGYYGKPRREPVRVQRIWNVFRGRENQTIFAEEFAEAFAGTKNPYNSAQTAISWLNREFRRFGVEIETRRFTAYRLRRRPPFNRSSFK